MAEIALARYRVRIEPRLIDRAGELAAAAAPAHRYAIITDDTVRGLYADRVRASFPDESARVYSFKAGESHKTRKTWAAISDAMLADGLGRDTTVIALGGGVVGDLAGFVAATYMRGVPVVQIPTTLLAMVDASVGGKTGLDVPAGKNLVGAFHWPAAVLVDPEVLGTLPPNEMRGGLAEAIKHGVVADGAYFEETRARLDRLAGSAFDRGAMTALIQGSIRIKAAVVDADERERGRRRILNFGHTIGHGIESASGLRVPHGDAVAIGMVAEAVIGERAGITARGTAAAIRDAVAAAGLPHRLPPGVTPEATVAATRSDKKARGGAVHYALPERIGTMAVASGGWSLPVADDIVLAGLQALD